ncbi:hypothetical protein KPH14_010266 [Odynerus spinipes]|uniref:Spliceosome-associated protein CWC27 homolog n=1 Tax=Odynerus spinipes TaxID=1348599 RepID=A0AAD9RTI9_9HYME|nr:hypothetical protein KPH14_010266 [Odynerus spinipes]
MSNVYIQEPPTSGKVVMKTSVGDIEIELWAKETPKACRNFIQLCMEGYYDDTIFHRVVKGFIVQGGDPTGTGEGGESIYGSPFKDEFHTRLRFCRRGLLAMANAGKDDNSSQFFFTLAATPELQSKHTIFGKVIGETLYNMLKLEEALVDENDRPIYPQKILKTEILNNPFPDIVPRIETKRNDLKESKKEKKAGVKNFKLLSFGEEAEEDEEESVVLNKQFNSKGKSAHDRLSDPKLSSQPVIDANEPPNKKIKENGDTDSDSDDYQSPETKAAIAKDKLEMTERIKSKLKEGKKVSESKKTEPPKVAEIDNAEEEEEEYYIGKERHEERQKKVNEIRKEIRDLKRSIQNEKKEKEAIKKEEDDKEEEKRKQSEILKDYLKTQEEYKKAKQKMPAKGKTREAFTLELLNKFRNKLHNAKESVKDDASTIMEEESKDDGNDESWMTHSLRCEEKVPVLAKDASTKADDWFEIYDPRNPLNKRRRGEKTSSKDKDSRDSGSSRDRSDSRNIRDNRDSRDVRDTRDGRNSREYRDNRDSRRDRSYSRRR